MAWLLISILTLKNLKWYCTIFLSKNFLTNLPSNNCIKMLNWILLGLPIGFSALNLRKLHLHFNKMENTDEKCQDHTADALYLSIREKPLLLLWNWNQVYLQFPIGRLFSLSLNVEVFWINYDSILKTPIWWRIYQKSKPLLGKQTDLATNLWYAHRQPTEGRFKMVHALLTKLPFSQILSHLSLCLCSMPEFSLRQEFSYSIEKCSDVLILEKSWKRGRATIFLSVSQMLQEMSHL